MGKNTNKNKYRKRSNHCSRRSASQRIRRARELSEKLKKSTEVHPQDNESVESSCDLPVISAVHGKDYFKKHPFCEQLSDKNEVHSEIASSTIIKIESFEEENDLNVESDNSALERVPVTIQQHYVNDHKILPSEINNSDCKIGPLNSQQFSDDKENELLFKIIKYLDNCAKVDKFDLAGKLYASKLRSVIFTNQQAMAENLCRQVLLEAEHFNLDEKIVLTKQHSHDYLNNRKSRVVVTNRSVEQSLHLQLEKGALFQNIQNLLLENTKEDRFDKFGKFYAKKMRSFSDMQYFYADKLINEIVLEAELCRLRANYKLAKLGNPPSHTFTTGQSYSKNCQSKVSDLLASNTACAVNTPLKQSDPNNYVNPLCPIYTIEQSYSKECWPKVYDLPSSKRAYAINNTTLKQSDQLIETSRKSAKKLLTYSKSIDKPFSTSLILTSNVTSIKNNAHELPKSMCLSVPKTVVKKQSSKKCLNKKQKDVTVDKKFDGSLFKQSLTVPTLTPAVTNHVQQFYKPMSVPCNTFSDRPNSTKMKKSTGKWSKNNSANAMKNSSLKLSLLPLTSTPSVISIQNNAHQLPQCIPSSIPNAFVSNVLGLLSFNQSCQSKWRGEIPPSPT